MKNSNTFVSVVCADYDTAKASQDLITAAFNPEGIQIKGNELLIPVPNSGLPFALGQLKNLVSPNVKIDMFDSEVDLCDLPSRIWYCI